jgi:hypothetical protein
MLYAEKFISSDSARGFIEQYLGEVRNPALKPLTVSDLTSIQGGSWPTEGQPGIYIFYGAENNLIYIGMSLDNISKRISIHLSERVQRSSFWVSRRPFYIQTILTPYRWEPPSLEEFLIQLAEQYSQP